MTFLPGPAFEEEYQEQRAFVELLDGDLSLGLWVEGASVSRWWGVRVLPNSLCGGFLISQVAIVASGAASGLTLSPVDFGDPEVFLHQISARGWAEIGVCWGKRPQALRDDCVDLLKRNRQWPTSSGPRACLSSHAVDAATVPFDALDDWSAWFAAVNWDAPSQPIWTEWYVERAVFESPDHDAA